MQASDIDESSQRRKMDELTLLARQMQELTMTIEQWTSEMTAPWVADKYDLQNIRSFQESHELQSYQVPHFPYPQLLSYDDIWLVRKI